VTIKWTLEEVRLSTQVLIKQACFGIGLRPDKRAQWALRFQSITTSSSIGLISSWTRRLVTKTEEFMQKYSVKCGSLGCVN
jgi:hypothetical protein